ncbi:cytochrome P450 [Xylariaceae sp. FL1651]|nr:cytochrome P450 [Xylariaceae sp. FL1651]
MPMFVHNLLYFLRAATHAQTGYRKLVSLPETVASGQAALAIDLAGRFTGLDRIVENRLQNIIIQRRLTPCLVLLIPRLEESANEAFDAHFPKESKGWTEVQPFSLLKHVAANLAADVLVGSNLRNDPTWLDISMKFTEDACFRAARRILGPEVKRLIQLHDSGVWEPRDDNVDDLNVLRWLCGQAKGKDRNPDTISHNLVLLVLASVHNGLFRILSVLYDLAAADPDLRDQLIAEIADTMDRGWKDMPYDRLYRLDSVLCESQRLSPPTALGMKRLFKHSYTFQDGTHVSAGTYTCMATFAIENDPVHTPNPEKYDGLRRFHDMENQRQDGRWDENTMAKRFRFSSPTPTALNCGYGKSACPGRHFASCIIKIVLVKLLTDYEFIFPPGTGRPRNMNAYDFTFNLPSQKILIRPKKHPMRTF